MVIQIFDDRMVRRRYQNVGIPFLVHLDQFPVFVLEHLLRHLLGICMELSVSVAVEPFKAGVIQLIHAAIDTTVEKIVFYGIDDLFDSAFGLRIVSLTEIDAESGLPPSFFI